MKKKKGGRGTLLPVLRKREKKHTEERTKKAGLSKKNTGEEGTRSPTKKRKKSIALNLKKPENRKLGK